MIDNLMRSLVVKSGCKSMMEVGLKESGKRKDGVNDTSLETAVVDDKMKDVARLKWMTPGTCACGSVGKGAEV